MEGVHEMNWRGQFKWRRSTLTGGAPIQLEQDESVHFILEGVHFKNWKGSFKVQGSKVTSHIVHT